MWTGALGAVLGPTFATLEKDAAESAGFNRLIGPLVFSGAYFVLAAVVVAVFMRPDPLVVAGGLAAASEPHVRRTAQVRGAFAVIRRFPGARLGLVTVVISQTTMVAVMTMTPLHIHDHGQADLSAFVIALHIVGMYGLAPVVGIAADRLGRVRVIQAGAAVLGLGTMVSVLAGYHPALIFSGLFLLGLGWSCGLIGGSTLLTESVPVHDRVAVQGAADLLMGVCGALGAVISGLVKAQLRVPRAGQRRHHRSGRPARRRHRRPPGDGPGTGPRWAGVAGRARAARSSTLSPAPSASSVCWVEGSIGGARWPGAGGTRTFLGGATPAGEVEAAAGPRPSGRRRRWGRVRSRRPAAPTRSTRSSCTPVLACPGACSTVPLGMPIAATEVLPVDVDALVVQLFQQEGASLVRLARIFVDDRNAAEDLVQEAFIRLARSAHRIQDESKAAAYLRSIVLNLARDSNRRGLVSLRHHLPLDDAARRPRTRSSSGGPARGHRRAARPAAPPAHCVVLRYYEELGIDDIAATMGSRRTR